MPDFPKFSDCDLSSTVVLDLVVDLDLLPLLVKRYIERHCCTHYSPDQSDQINFQHKFLLKENISSLDDLSLWLTKNNVSEPQLSKYLYHSLQLKMFKEEHFSSSVEKQFLENKSNLDKVMYSMIRTTDSSKAREFYLRIIEEEDSLSDIASEYSEGIEQQLNGLIGPVEFGRLNPAIAERLRISTPGQLWEPFQEDGWWILLRLEKLLPARLDALLTERIINDSYGTWLRSIIADEISIIVDKYPQFRTSLNPTPSSPPSQSSNDANSRLSRILGNLKIHGFSFDK